MQYKEAVRIVTAFTACHLTDGCIGCDMCPAYNEEQDQCDNSFCIQERLSEAVNLIMSFESITPDSVRSLLR